MKKLATIIISGLSNFIIYWVLLVISPFLFFELFMDVDASIETTVFMIMGVGVGPIVAAWLSGVSTKRLDKLNGQKKFIVLSVQSLLAISIFIFILNG